MIFPDWVENYIGLPFEEYNCYDLVRKIFIEQFNIALCSFDGEYFDSMDKENIRKLFLREMILWKKAKTPVVGDVIICRINGQPWHVGMIIGLGYMLHTEKGSESVIERYGSDIWKNRIVGFYRYIE